MSASGSCVGVSASGSGGVHLPQADTPHQADTSPTPETATSADGTHPTGMASCFLITLGGRLEKCGFI